MLLCPHPQHTNGPLGLATRLPGSGGLQHLQDQAAGTVAGDVSRARMVSLVLLCPPTPKHMHGPRGLATRLPGSGDLQHLQAQAAGTVAGDVSNARMVSLVLLCPPTPNTHQRSTGSSNSATRIRRSLTSTGPGCWNCSGRCI